MAAAKKSAPKKTSKRRKAIAKPIRRKMAKRTLARKMKPKAKARPVARRPLKSIAKKKLASKVVARKPLRKTPRMPAHVLVEDTIVDIVEEPEAGGVPVTEHEVVRTIAPGSDSSSDEE